MINLQLHPFGKQRKGEGLLGFPSFVCVLNKVPHLNVKPHFHRGRLPKQLPGARVMRLQMILRFPKTVNLTVITVVALALGACRPSNVGGGGEKYTCINKSQLCVFHSTKRSYKKLLFTFSEANFAVFYLNRLQCSYLKEPTVDGNSLKAKARTAPIWSGCRRVISELEPTL